MDFRICVFILNVLIMCCVINNMDSVYCVNAECSSVTVPLSSFAQDSKTLNGYTYRQVSQVPNVQICARNCLLHRMCRSINYNSDIEICYLNSEDHFSKPQALSPSVTSQYYIIDGWPELHLSGCQHHTCPETHVCEVRFLGLYPTYTCVAYDLSTGPSTTPLLPTIGCTNGIPAVSEVNINAVPVRFSPVACVHSPGDTFGTLLHNYREGLDWYDMQPVIEGCAGLAHTNSYRYFGIEYYGECWADQAFLEASHTKIPADQCDSQTYLAVGIANVVCVYELV